MLLEPIREHHSKPSAEPRVLTRIEEGRTPLHVAIIMDGNGRWAQRRRLPRAAGHRQGRRKDAHPLRVLDGELDPPR